MKKLSALETHDLSALRGLVFDLDGTILTDGRLSTEALDGLWRMADAGWRLVACTGRSAGWAEVVARQWPIDVAIAENGAVAFACQGHKLVCIDRLEAQERRARQARLKTIADQVAAEHTDALFTDDNRTRITDLAFDIGETQVLPPERIHALSETARKLGARTFASSIHLHLTLDTDDKASGTAMVLRRLFDEDEVAMRRRYAFVGDSGNDASCFAAFRTTFGVSNVVPHLSSFTVAPAYVTDAEQGAGFAELAALLATHRPQTSSD